MLRARKWWSVGVAAVVLGAVLVVAANFASAQKKNKIVIAISSTPAHFHPWWTALESYHLFAQIYNVLVRLDDQGVPQPELAESWSFSPDGRVLTLKLRKGVKFHSGREFVADDVKRSLARGTHPDVAANFKPLAKSVQVNVVDRYTVQMVSEGPNPAIFDLLDMFYIADDDQFDKHTTQPIGSGPFALHEYIPGDRIVLRPFKDYFRKENVKIGEVEFKAIGDAQARVLNLESGTIDAVGDFPTKEAPRLRSKGFTVAVAGKPIFYNFLFNVKDPRFSNKKLRQLFTYTANRTRLNRLVLDGQAEALCMPWAKTSLAFDPEFESRCEFNLDKAKKMLTEVGYPNGIDFTLMTSTKWFYGMTKMAEILHSDWQKIGLRATIQDVDKGEYLKRHNSNEFEVVMSLTGRFMRDPAALLGMTTTWRPVGNSSGYEDARYVELHNAAASTLDPAKRKALYREINTLLWDAQFTVPLVTAPTLLAHTSRLKNISFTREGYLTLEHAFIE
jgi:peptide/nickel transport system substrate-binding protein